MSDYQKRSPRHSRQRWLGSMGAKPDRGTRRPVHLLLSYLAVAGAFSSITKPPSNAIRVARTSLGSATSTSPEMDGSATTGGKLRAAVYQPPIALPKDDEAALAATNPLEVLTEVAEVLGLASRCSIDVVQFPEFFLTGGGFLKMTAGRSTPLDRESYALNIVGNICGELNVACVMGYAETKHASESQMQGPNASENQEEGFASDGCCYSSLAIFHSDGSRAGNYRCLRPPVPPTVMGDSDMFVKGHPLVEAMPISVRLPVRQSPPTHQKSSTVQQEMEAKMATSIPRQVKLGAMCGGDLLVPEHACHLARSGAEMLVVSGSLFDDQEDTRSTSFKMATHVLQTRCMENELPLLFSNYVDDEKDNEQGVGKERDVHFVGLSAIVSCDGTELVRAPESLSGDMPGDAGYFLPCETGGALYAADIDIPTSNKNRSGGTTNINIDASIDEWDIAPRIQELGGGKEVGNKSETGFRKDHRRKTKGFGREVVEVLERNKERKLRLKNK